MSVQRSLVSIPGSNNLFMPPAPLFVLRSADMTSTGDQSFTKVGQFTNWLPTYVIAVRKTGAFSTACVGGIYTGAAKSGDVIISASQTWANLTGAAKVVSLPFGDIAFTGVETATPILALTTGNGATLTADFFIYGVILD